jgi:enamine deaminase RidA (YjgF/YER057c/UK114 family)
MRRVIESKALGAPLGLYSHGMVVPAGELVVVAGQVGVGPSGSVANDAGAQTKQAFANVDAVLDAAGCSLRDVVRLQTFLTRATDIPAFMRAREEVFAESFPDGDYPPNTLLVVSRLVRPELLVEIEAMAVRPGRRAQRARSVPASARARATGAKRPRGTTSAARAKRPR